MKYLEKKADKVNIDLEVTNKTKQNNWQKVFTANKDSFNVQKFPMQSQVNSYTDGSKNGDHVGCNFVVYRGYKEIWPDSITMRQPEYCTVYQAEVAIHLAAQKAAHVLDDKDNYIKQH